MNQLAALHLVLKREEQSRIMELIEQDRNRTYRLSARIATDETIELTLEEAKVLRVHHRSSATA